MTEPVEAKEPRLTWLEEDRLHEECGVFGIFNHTDAAALTALGLHALQPVSYTHLTLPTKA